MEFKTKLLNTLTSLQANEELLKEIQAADEATLQQWIQFIDDSPDSLMDWCKALLEFKKWEVAQNRSLTLAHKIEYLSCCREGGANAGTLVSLSDLLADYLRDHGVE